MIIRSEFSNQYGPISPESWSDYSKFHWSDFVVVGPRSIKPVTHCNIFIYVEPKAKANSVMKVTDKNVSSKINNIINFRHYIFQIKLKIIIIIMCKVF